MSWDWLPFLSSMSEHIHVYVDISVRFAHL